MMKETETFLRTEEKFDLSEEQAQAFLKRVEPYIVPDVYPTYTLHSLYYDTDSYAMIANCLAHPMYREKLRLRSYGDPVEGKPVYVEIKKKFHGLGQKRRTAILYQKGIEDTDVFAHLPSSQIGQEIASSAARYDLSPAVFVAYDRQAFTDETGMLRLTMDRNLTFRTSQLSLYEVGPSHHLLHAPQVLMEIKLAGSYPLWLVQALTALHLYPSSFSKYGEIFIQLNQYKTPLQAQQINYHTKETNLCSAQY
ncbi:MAG: polyphosphate polymerase domain-containing protein [Lactimicrobium sp.]|jgi:hypothetical protein|uniref:polyphosphate polymerase domain-containing protein n=1 Tax=Lactimicrobium sp. TaxID=2563780 RepID=UPI002F356643